MSRYPPFLFLATWLAWALYWRAESRAAKANVWAESITSRLMHVVPTVVAAPLLVLDVPVWGLDARLWAGVGGNCVGRVSALIPFLL